MTRGERGGAGWCRTVVMALLRKYGPWVAPVVCWGVVVYFLRAAIPIFVDGSGPMPGLWWGDGPAMTMGEYMRRLVSYRLLFWVPYGVAGGLITGVGAGLTPWLMRGCVVTGWRRFFSGAAITLSLLLGLAAAMDMATWLGVLKGGLLVLYGDHDWHTIWCTGLTILPGSMVGGLAAAGWLGLGRRGRAAGG